MGTVISIVPFSLPLNPCFFIVLVVCCIYCSCFEVVLVVFIVILFQLSMSQTYQPKKRKRARSHGFLKRAATPGGKKTVLRRRRKGRAKLSR